MQPRIRLMRLSCLLLTFLPGLLLARGETLAGCATLWARTWNGPENWDEKPTALLCDTQGNVVVAGYSYGTATDFDFLVLKYDSSGNLLWTRTFGSPLNSEDRIWAACLDAQGNIYVTGGSIADTLHNWDYLTIKFRPNGDTAWTRRYDSPFHGEDKPAAIGPDDSGNVYVSGASRGKDKDWDYLTIKYTPQGETLWTRRWDGSAHLDDLAARLAVDHSGSVVVSGKSFQEPRQTVIATVKYASNGKKLWQQIFSGTGTGHNWATDLMIDARNSVFICGAVTNKVSGYDCVLLRYTPAGKLVWSRTYDGTGHKIDIANALAGCATLQIDTAGNIYVTGQSMGSGSLSDFVTLKYDPDGETLWVRRYNGKANAEDQGQAIAVTDSGVYVTGASVQQRPYQGFLTVAYDSSGTEKWEQSYASKGLGDSKPVSIVRGPRNRIVVTGYWCNEAGNLDVVTVAYRP